LKADDDVVLRQFFRNEIQRGGSVSSNANPVFFQKSDHLRIDLLCGLTPGTGVLADQGKLFTGNRLGDLALTTVIFIEKQYLVGLRGFGLAGDGINGVLANILGLVGHPGDGAEYYEHSEQVLYVSFFALFQ
jgi:hypothetical protein